MVLSLWGIRESDVTDADLIPVYESNPNYFSLKIHHGGVFSNNRPRRYVNGRTTYVDLIDIDTFSVHELNFMMKDIGYTGNDPMYYHFLAPDLTLDYGLHALGCDVDVHNLSTHLGKAKIISVYVEHGITNVNTYFKSPQASKVRIEEIGEESSQTANKSMNAKTHKRLMLDWNYPVGNECQNSCLDSDVPEVSEDVHQGVQIHNVTSEIPIDQSLFDDLPDSEFNPFWGLPEVNTETMHVNVNNDKGKQVDEAYRVSVEGLNDEGGDGDDSDYIQDEDNPLFEVEVDMRDFNLSVDQDVEFVGSEKQVDEEENCEFHYVVLDNDKFDSDSDEGLDSERKKQLRQLHSSGTVFYVGQTFGTSHEVKEVIRRLAIESRREIKIIKNDKIRVRAVCEGIIPSLGKGGGDAVCSMGSTHVGKKGSQESQSKLGGRGNKGKKQQSFECTWVLHVSKLPNTETWMVKTFNDVHICLQSRVIKHCTYKYLATEIVDQIETNPEVPVKAIREQLEKKFELGVSRMKAYRAKSNANFQLMGDYKDQYAMLRDYCLELNDTNPGTTVKIEVEEGMEDTNTRVFKRIYVCLSALKNGFKVLARDLLGLDGAFMKGPYPGQLLTAVGLDSNNGIYPVAYAIVEAETSQSWKWFLECLGADLDLGRRSNFTFITDRQKGLIQAIASVFPCAEHRFCLRHLHENMKLQWRGRAYKDHLWKCATATTVPHFKKYMDELKSFNTEAYNWLVKIPPQHWSRSHFSGRANSDVLLNNMCEVFNKQLVEARDKPIITALEYTREYLMKRIVNVLKVIEKCEGPLTPSATKCFDVIKVEAAKYNVLWNGGTKYQVSGPWSDQCVVDTAHNICTCRKWEITGMPCKHAVATIWNMGVNGQGVGLPESFVNPVYWLETWKKVYCFRIDPVKGRPMWPKSNVPTALLPPKHHTPIGRPKKMRRKAADEGQGMVAGGKLSRKLKTVTCGKCGNSGHNQRGCKGQGGSNAGGGGSRAKRKSTASSSGGGSNGGGGTNASQGGVSSQVGVSSAGGAGGARKSSAGSGVGHGGGSSAAASGGLSESVVPKRKSRATSSSKVQKTVGGATASGQKRAKSNVAAEGASNNP